MKLRLNKLGCLVLVLAGCVAPGPTPSSSQQASTTTLANKPPAEQPGATLQSFFDELDQPDLEHWEISDGYTNGPVFHCGWRKSNASFEGGKLRLRLDDEGCPDACSGKPHAAAEYQSKQKYGYGRYEARMKPGKASGTMSGSLFTYNAEPQDEIDIEFLGKDTTTLQTNYFTSGVGQHASIIELGFDAAQAFHDYAFEWRPDSITWFVDGKPVHREDGSRGALPRAAGSLVLNLWPGHTVDSWLGPLRYEKPVDAEYEWVRFTPLRELGPESAEQQNIAKPKAFVPPAPGNVFWIDDFETNGAARNGALWVAEQDKHNLGTRITPSPFAPTAGGAPGSPAHAGRMSGHLGPSRAPWPYAVLSIDITSPARPSDLRQFKALEFWAKGDGRNFRVQLAKASIADWGHPEVQFQAPKSWTKLSLPLSRFAQPSWAVKVEALPSDVTNLVFGAIDGDQDFDLWLDDVRFVK